MTGKFNKYVVLISLALLLSAVPSLASPMTSESYSMPTCVIDSAGSFEATSSGTYELYYTVRQSTPIGASESDNYRLGAGYIYTLFDEIYICGVKIDGNDISKLKYISGKPAIEADILDERAGPGMPTVEVYIDGKKYLVALKPAGANEYHFSFIPPSELKSGDHIIEIRAANLDGSTDHFEFRPFKPSAVASVTGRMKNVPNPFRPHHGEGTTIIYDLSAPADIRLIIYDIAGKIVWQRQFPQNSNGGTIHNEVPWDGKTDFGEYAPNGIYIYLITRESKILAKGQMAVMD